jgi:signal transduction histidine kinase/CheY-like chemotaxis protein
VLNASAGKMHASVLPGFLPGLRERIRNRPDTEFQQALIRVVIGFICLAYFSSSAANLDETLLGYVQAFIVFFTGVALLVAASALFSRQVSPLRRIIAMLIDFSTCSFLLASTAEAGSPLLVVYLWVTLGNGLRYGVAYLYGAIALAITGLSLVLVFSPFWHGHLTIGASFLLAMVAIPLYTASLIKQVHEAIQRERKASYAKNLFLANMSHEIRTPLTAIIGFSEALLDINQTMAERIEGIKTINRAGKHLLGVISDILNLSKIEAGKVEVERLPVPLFALLDEVAAMASLQAEAKGIYFRVDPVFPLPQTIESDPIRIKQILFNVIGNAIKFTEQGGVKLRVRHEPAAALLVVEVIDTGIGISPEQVSRLFQAFTQADASTTRRFGGTGLGLALSRQLAELLGGSIDVASLPGRGSSFTITLDTGAVGAFIHSSLEMRQLALPAEEEADLRPVRGSLLLAEDNSDNQRLISLKARRLGVEPTVVENGAQAVEAALAQPYDLILMDMQMPVMDGLTAVRTLRDKGYRGPIVALTANTSAQDRQNCLDAGFDGFLSKPVEQKRFEESVRSYLKAESEDGGEDDEPIFPFLLLQDPGLAELMTHFLGNIEACHRDLQQALDAGDIGSIQRLARQMKAAGSNYKCPRLTELAGQMEFAATADNGQAMRKLAEQLARLVKRIRTHVPPQASGQRAADAEPPLVSELLDEDPDMADLVEYLIGRLPGYEQTLQLALESGDFAALKKQAHDLKSVGGGYGYPLVTELAVRMESSALEGKLEDVSLQVEAFARLARRIRAGAPALQSAPGDEMMRNQPRATGLLRTH